ncbi:MAG: hypothetical protein WKF89_09055 [Chitinophagaceae bacterium]
MVTKYRDILKQMLPLLLFEGGAVLLFSPLVEKYFVSDDFLVLNRVCLNRDLLVKGFFRPLSDITIYCNYLLGGFNPVGYNMSSFLLHGLNSFLLFQLCRKWKWSSEKGVQYMYATIAGVLFLTYPFHNESIAWMLGRGSLIAAGFGLAALLFLVSDISENKKIIAACLCYFIGLAAYESIIMLPVIFFLVLVNQKLSKVKLIKWLAAFLLVVCFHLFLRKIISGSILGSYGQEMLQGDLVQYSANVYKVLGRLLIPPLQNQGHSLIIAGLVTLTIGCLMIITYKHLKNKSIQNRYLLNLSGCLALSLIIPVLFNVSTKTSESDRFLYFPSLFLCCVVSLLIVSLFTSKAGRIALVIFIAGYNIIFLEWNNLNWRHAGEATQSIIQVIRKDSSGKKLFIANLPGEFDGAYVFRLGFKQALLINNIDTARINVLNILSREENMHLSEIIKPVYSSSGVFVPPVIKLNFANNGIDTVYGTKGALSGLPGTSYRVYYWNKKNMVPLK